MYVVIMYYKTKNVYSGKIYNGTYTNKIHRYSYFHVDS